VVSIALFEVVVEVILETLEGSLEVRFR